MKVKYRKIAIIMGAGIGDFFVRIPLIQKIKKTLTSCEITLIGKQNPNKALINSYPLVKEIVDIKGNFVEKLKALTSLNENKFDLLILGYSSQFPETKLTILLSYLINAKTKIRKIKDKIKLSHINMVDILLQAAKEAGFIFKNKDYSIPKELIDWDASKKVNDIIFNKLPSVNKKSPLILFHVGAKLDDKSRLWPRENWQEVITFLNNNYHTRLVFIGSKADEEETAIIIKDLNFPILNLVSKLSIEESIAAINNCALFISTNSGPMHIAAIFKKKQIAICGPSKMVWDPTYNQNAIILRSNTCTLSCEKKECPKGNNVCMKSIRPEIVIKTVKKVLGQNEKN